MKTPIDEDHILYEPDDYGDTVAFGKYKDTLTPRQILEENPQYIVWAANNTNHWIGSAKLILTASARTGIPISQRARENDPEIEKNDTELNNRVAQFEHAVLDAYGQWPKPIWIRN